MGAAFWNFGRVVIGAAALAFLAHPAPAFADTANIVGYNLSVDVDYPPLDPFNPADTPTLTNVVILVAHATPGAPSTGNFSGILYWTAQAQPTATLEPIQIPASDVTQPLALSDEEQFAIGPSTLGIGPDRVVLFADYTDAGNVQHVVVGMDSTAAAAVAGQSFADTFPATSVTESDLDNALHVLNTFDPPGTEFDHPGSGCGDGPCGDAQDVIADFSDDMQLMLQLQPFTNIDGLAALPPGTFDLVSYSDGEILGSGTANLIPVFGPPTVSNSVPEPSTWAMMLLGFAGLGYAGYRRSRNSVRPSGVALG
ncbi:MAG TPA: PEPxxWA-CTERM sorting domain-containing protein [Roseiarcus sp.]